MTDDELIAQAVAEARDETELALIIIENWYLAQAVARHLLSRDPEAVRVPLKGTVS